MNDDVTPFDGLSVVILAAGSSSRMPEKNKLLLRTGDQALIERIVAKFNVCGLRKVIVVTGFESDKIEQALKGFAVEFVYNPKWSEGMGSSLAMAASVLVEGNATGALVCLGDLPYLQTESIASIVNKFNELRRRTIVAPSLNGKLGHPVAFPRSFFAELCFCSGDVGAKNLLKTAEVKKVEMKDSGIFRDVDRLQDLMED
jgi:molybdenum cofactor cytidylyltransferase